MVLKVGENSNCSTSIQEKLVVTEQWQLSDLMKSDLVVE